MKPIFLTQMRTCFNLTQARLYLSQTSNLLLVFCFFLAPSALTYAQSCIPPSDIVAPASCVGGGTTTFSAIGGSSSNGTWLVSGGGIINPSSGAFTPTTPGCYTVTFSLALGCSLTEAFIVFPEGPTLFPLANTCNTPLVYPTISAPTGFYVQYSLDGGAFATSYTPPTNPGCHTFQIRYLSSVACGDTPANTVNPCGPARLVSGIIFPPVPVLGPIANTCNGVLTLPSIPAVPGFGVQWVVDNTSLLPGATTAPVTPGCHSVYAYYYLNGSCLPSVTATAPNAPIACLASATSFMLAFPPVPVLTAPSPTCAGPFVLPPVPAISGLSVEYSINGAPFVASPAIPSAPGCYTISARYVSTVACGNLPAGTAGTGVCAASAPVTTRIFPQIAVTPPGLFTVCNTQQVQIPPFISATTIPPCLSVNPTITWTNSNPSIGLAASGTGSIPAFTAINTGFKTVQTATIIITPGLNMGNAICPGVPTSFNIVVNPTPVPRFDVVKSIFTTTDAPCPIVSQKLVTFQIKLTNTGNIPLEQVQLVDMLGSQLGAALVSVTSVPSIVTGATNTNATAVPTLNLGFNGTTQTNIFAGTTAAGTTGFVDCDQFVTIRFTALIDPNANCPNVALNNQARALGSRLACGATQLANNLSNNLPINLPAIQVVKKMERFLCTPQCGPNVEVIFTIKVANTGNTILNDIAIFDNLAAQMGLGFTRVIPSTLYYASHLSNALAAPAINSAFTGSAGQDNLLLPASTVLRPCETMVFQFVAEVNSALGGPIMSNRALARGFYPSTSGLVLVNDLSDSGSNPESNNPGELGDTACEDDPTFLCLPVVEEQPADLTVNTCDNWQFLIANWLDAAGGAEVDDNCNTLVCIVNNYYDTSNPWVYQSCALNQYKIVKFTYKYIDQNGQMSEMCICARIDMIDNTAPRWDMQPMNKTVACGPNAQTEIQSWLNSNGGGWVFDCGGDVRVTNNYATTTTCGTRTITFTATDICGNATAASGTLTITDNVAPTLTSVPANTTITCPALPVFGTPSANDNCSTPTLTFTDATNGGPCPAGYSVTRTWLATDACGNTRTASSTITVLPAPQPAVLTLAACPANITRVAAVGATGVVVTFTAPTATSTCTTGSVSVTQIAGPTSGQTFAVGATQVTFRATDGCGNSQTCSFTVTVSATVNPPTSVLTLAACPANANVTAAFGASSAVVTFSAPTATSTCTTGSVSVTQIAGPTSGQTFAVGATQVTFRATDGCGNSQTCSLTVTVNANTNPPSSVLTLTAGPNRTITCGQPIVFGTPNRSTTCPTGTVNVTFADATTGTACTGITHTRTFTATDVCGNVKTATESVFVSPDQTPPTFTSLPPTDKMINCGTPVSIGTATATDNCSNATVTSLVTNNGASSCNTVNGITYGFDTYVKWTATDGCGNTTTAQTNIWVLPVTNIGFLSKPDDKSVACNEPVVFDAPPMPKSYMAPITSITHVDVVKVDACGAGTITRVWTAIDELGNECKAEQVVTVLPDAVVPVVALPQAAFIVQCGEAMPFAPPTASDNCASTNDLQIVHTDNHLSDRVERTWTVSDLCGNTTTAMQTMWVADQVAPVFAPLTQTYERDCDASVVFDQPSVTDCSTTTLTFGNTVQYQNCEAIHTRTWLATDASGNTSTARQTIVLRDRTAPVFAATSQTVNVNCGDPIPFAPPTATDNCASATSLQVTHADQVFSDRTERTWTATDLCGNVSTAMQTFKFVDLIAPVFAPIAPSYVLDCDAVVVFDEPTATDNCSSVLVSFTNTVQQQNCQTVHTRKWLAQDASGNMSSLSQTITVLDRKAPVFVAIPQAKTVGCGDPIVFDTPTATDACGNVGITITDSQTQPICAQTGYTMTRTWTANDGCDNLATATQIITIAEDVVAPVFTTLIEPQVEMTAAQFAQIAKPTAQDDCNQAVTVTQSSVQLDACNHSVTFVATDDCGNATTALQQVKITDGVCAPLAANDVTLEQTLVYPNPTTGKVFIALPTALVGADVYVRVFDALGKEIRMQNLSSQLNVLELGDFAHGVYQVQLWSQQQSATIRVVKTK
jgi:uncharacterized repeat protein (TIGR01451 family)